MKMPDLAIVGGTGLTALNGLEIIQEKVVSTPYGEPSSPLVYGQLADREVVFLARHGQKHTIPPHRINYRANIWALKQAGIKHIVAVAAVGGITTEMSPARIVIPDQIIDYTSSRQHTYFEDNLAQVTHIDFTSPYDPFLRDQLIQLCRKTAINAVEQGTYGATQGPRLETSAEISRMERDGCDIVGMTGMPEAALARELELGYATCAVVANWAAGKGDQAIIEMAEIERTVGLGMGKVRTLLEQLVPSL